MKIDLHCHTFPASACSNMKVDDLIQKSKDLGLDGICLTEHNKPWDRDEVLRLRDKFSFPIFRGMEVTTKDGDVLVFGLHKEMNGTLTAAELRTRVSDAGGFMVAAHPFRGFLLFSFVQLQLTPERAAGRAIFQSVDAIEAYNCKVTDQETQMAFNVSELLRLPCVGGSDAHTLADVGKYFTHFEANVTSEEEMIAELAAGRFHVKPLPR